MKEARQMEQYYDMLHPYVATAALMRIGCGLQLQRLDKSPSTSRLWTDEQPPDFHMEVRCQP